MLICWDFIMSQKRDVKLLVQLLYEIFVAHMIDACINFATLLIRTGLKSNYFKNYET